MYEKLVDILKVSTSQCILILTAQFTFQTEAPYHSTAGTTSANITDVIQESNSLASFSLTLWNLCPYKLDIELDIPNRQNCNPDFHSGITKN